MKFFPIPGCFNPVFCSGSHLIGSVVFSVLTLYLLSRNRCDPGCKIAVAVFGFACVFLLAVSAAYHFVPPDGIGHKMLRQLDHAAIFGLIGGSLTPVQWIFFTGLWRWGILLLVWAMVAMGITLNMIYFESISAQFEMALYLGIGWFGLVPAVALWRRYGFRFVQPFVFGGLMYTSGALGASFGVPWMTHGALGPHEFLHIAALAGLTFHWQFIFRSLETVTGKARYQFNSPLALRNGLQS